MGFQLHGLARKASFGNPVVSERQNPKRATRPELLARFFVGLLSSPRLGLVLLGMIFTYLALASLLPGLLGVPQAQWTRLYTAWPLKAYLWAVAVNAACASIFRIPFRWDRLGAHLAHLGVIVLAAGASWYVARSVSGYAVAGRDPVSGLFIPVDRFYLEKTGAVYVSVDPASGAGAAESPLPLFPQAEAAERLNIPVSSPLKGVSIAVTGSDPAADVGWLWRDDGPAEAPAVEVVVHDGPHAFRRVLCMAYAFASRFDTDAYTVRFAAEAEAARLARLARDAETDVAAIIRPANAAAELAVFRPDGSSERHPAEPGKAITLVLGGREVKLEVVRFLTRAWRAGVARPVRQGQAPAAVKLDVTVGKWRGSLWVGRYHSVRPIDPADPDLQRLPLPAGRMLYFQFAPQYRPLGKTFAIAQMRYLTYPDSGIPRDYVCSLAVLDSDGQPTEQLECRLNRPADLGPFRLYQDEWRPDPEKPTEVIFLVRARPGIRAIWLGCGLICAGIPCAFYLKPLLRRRAGRARP